MTVCSSSGFLLLFRWALNFHHSYCKYIWVHSTMGTEEVWNGPLLGNSCKCWPPGRSSCGRKPQMIFEIFQLKYCLKQFSLWGFILLVCLLDGTQTSEWRFCLLPWVWVMLVLRSLVRLWLCFFITSSTTPSQTQPPCEGQKWCYHKRNTNTFLWHPSWLPCNCLWEKNGQWGANTRWATVSAGAETDAYLSGRLPLIIHKLKI